MPDAVVGSVNSWDMQPASVHFLLELLDPGNYSCQGIADGVRQPAVFQVRSAPRARLAAHHDLPGHAHDHRVRRHRLDDDCIRADAAVGANGDRTQDFAPAPTTTLSSNVGWRFPLFRLVPPRVTPWYNVTLAPISAVSPITTPMP